jgi:hypothetical protein
VRPGDEIDAAASARIDGAFLGRVAIRSPAMCRSAGGVCARCYGRDPTTRRLVAVGRTVGADAARTIAARALGVGPRLSFGTGTGIRCGPAPPSKSTVAGVAHHEHLEGTPLTSSDWNAQMRMTARAGRLSIRDERGRVIESFRVTRGDDVIVPHGTRVERGEAMVVQGFRDDDPPIADEPPRPEARYMSWGGIEELIEMLRDPPRERVVLAAYAGVVRSVAKSNRSVSVRIAPDDGGPPIWQVVPKGYGTHLGPGDRVVRGHYLGYGCESLRDRVRLFGRGGAAERLLDEIAGFFADRGVAIADVHLEMVIRNALNRVR